MMIHALALALSLSAGSASLGPGEDFQTALSGLEGDWDGVLIYRDFRTDARVTLPHQRTVTIAPDGSYAQTALVFTDPGYQVYASELVTIDGAQVQIAYAGGGEINLSEAQIVSFEPTETGWSAILTGPTIDNGAQAQARYTYVVDDTHLSIEKAVRTDSEEAFRFRNAVEMDRR